jgi:hypothetical protein
MIALFELRGFFYGLMTGVLSESDARFCSAGAPRHVQ